MHCQQDLSLDHLDVFQHGREIRCSIQSRGQFNR